MNSFKKILALLCLISAFALTLSGCTYNTGISNNDQNEGLQEIIVGSDNYPPFNFVNADGSPIGIDVELAKEAFRRMGYKAVFVSIDWEDKKNLLADGSVDCVWGSFSMDGRENEYNWAGPYMVSCEVVAVSVESDIYTLADLEDKTVAVQTTTKPEEIFLDREDDRIPKIRSLIALQNRELIYPFLSKGYADALSAHETAIRQYMKDYDMQFRILDETLMVTSLGVAFDKNDNRGLDIQLTLEQMRNDGTEKAIISTYLDDADKYLEVDGYGK